MASNSSNSGNSSGTIQYVCVDSGPPEPWDYYPWVQQPRSAYAFAYFACALIGIATIKFLLTAIRDRNSLTSQSSQKVGIVDRGMAVFRYTLYRSPKWLYGCEPTAAVVIGALGVYTLIWLLALHPYYDDQCWQSGSPILSVRAGWFSLSTTPFIYILASKKNPVSLLTKIPYEKLNVYHRWLARILLITTLIHGVPFFVRALQDHTLAAEWAASKAYWTGVVAWFILLWMVISSLFPFRRMAYEFFVIQHIISALAYLVFVFLHTRDLFTSWLYLWATVAIYGASVGLRFLGQAWWNTGTSKATISVLVDNAVTVSIEIPNVKGNWRAGQHIFIRFLALSPWQCHPFTVASVEEDGQLVLIISKKSGLTKRLYQKCERRKNMEWNTRVLIDGPYGGPPRDPASFNSVVLCSGGVGVTFTLPVLKDLVQRIQDEGKIRCSHVVFVWAVRSEKQLEWIKDELLRCASADDSAVQVQLYVTDPKLSFGDKDVLAPNVTVDYQRPKIGKILEGVLERNQGSMCVMGCGPTPLTNSLGNECARLQKEVIAGTSSGEIFLHVETFGW